MLILRSVWALVVIFSVANVNIKKVAIDWVPREGIPPLTFRCFQGSISDVINYVCAAHLPLGIVGVINNLGPIVTVILAMIFLKETIPWSDALFLLLSFIGCLMTVLGASPSNDTYKTITEAPTMYGALFCCPILSGCGTIALRKMRKLNAQSVTLWSNLFTLVFNIALVLICNCW